MAMFTLMGLMCATCVLAWPSLAITQEFSNRAVKFVVPFPAGGPADTMSRILTEKMATVLGQAIVVESRAGAGGLTGIASVARAEIAARCGCLNRPRHRSRLGATTAPRWACDPPPTMERKLNWRWRPGIRSDQWRSRLDPGMIRATLMTRGGHAATFA
jgi:hypothetical protein